MSERWTDIIRQVHASSKSCVLCITGGGSPAIGSLLSVPGGSRTVLEAVVPYAPQSLDEWLRRRPDSYCSRETALSMATMAWARAKSLTARQAPETSKAAVASGDAGDALQSLVGVACTASLVSDLPKKGEHRCFVATQTADATRCYSLKLRKGARDRAGEEAIVASVILLAITEACGVSRSPNVELLDEEVIEVEAEWPSSLIRNVWLGAAPWVWSLPGGELTPTLPEPPRGLLSGSFHPLHHGHERLARVAEQILGGHVAYELPIVNADKPRLDYLSIEARRRQFTTRPVALTAAPLFADKARLFPQTTFIVGADTAERLLDARFHDHSEPRLMESFAELRRLGCRFLVAGRVDRGHFETLAELHIPETLRDLFSSIPESVFRDDISSTALRKLGDAV